MGKKCLPVALLFFFSILVAKSSFAQVTALQALATTTQLANQTVTAGQTATFSVVAAGTASPSYQWQNRGTSIRETTSASYTVAAATSGTDDAAFHVEGSTSAEDVMSSAVSLAANSISGASAITQQLQSQTVQAGQSATFTVVISNGPCRSVWYINGAEYYGSEASTISYTIPNTTLAMNGWTVFVNLYDCGSTGANLGNSQTAILTVKPATGAPTITTQPANQAVTAGQTASFAVVASGTAPLSYQWQKNGANISGATSASYTTPATASTNNGSTFQVVVSNSAGSVTSSSATLTVNAANSTPGAPAVTQQLQSQTVQAGQSATFTVVISNGPCHSLWYINGTGYYGSTASTISYTIENTTSAMNGWTVFVDLYDCGSTGANLGNSQTAILTVNPTLVAPTITKQLSNQAVTAGQTATFSVVANGTAPLTYQWQKNGANISGATSASYTTPATTSADSGSTFRIGVSNTAGNVMSSAATLTVNAASLAVSITSPTNGASVSGTITVSGTASDGESVTLVQLSVDNGSFSNASGTNTWSFSLDTAALSNAAHTLTAKATDSSGNTDTSNPISITVNNSTGSSATIDSTTTYQTITGFGAATAFQCRSSSAGECNGNGNPWTTQELNLLYDQNLGIGLSLIRFKIEENGSFPYNTNILNAIAKGAQAWGAPWSPPASMKTNGSIDNGGYLEAASYQAWASQLVNYISALKNTYGIPVYAISVQNEPNFVASYESAQYNAQQFHDFVLNNLCPTLQSVGLGNVKIMIAEESTWTFDLASTTRNDPAANACIGIYAAHGYNVSSPAAFTVSPGQQLWETEDSDLGAQDTSSSNGLAWAQKLHNYLTVANVNAWHYWWAVDSVDTTGQGLLNDESGTLVIPTRFYMIGQYTKFIRPGYVRIGATASPVARTYVSAYKNPANSSQVVIVAINQGSGNANVTFQFNGFTATSVTPYVSNGTLNLTPQASVSSTSGSFSYTLLPFSVTTFVSQ
jgi:O-glycosyl hydrolase